jgi:hypothetical protein
VVVRAVFDLYAAVRAGGKEGRAGRGERRPGASALKGGRSLREEEEEEEEEGVADGAEWVVGQTVDHVGVKARGGELAGLGRGPRKQPCGPWRCRTGRVGQVGFEFDAGRASEGGCRCGRVVRSGPVVAAVAVEPGQLN